MTKLHNVGNFSHKNVNMMSHKKHFTGTTGPNTPKNIHPDNQQTHNKLQAHYKRKGGGNTYKGKNTTTQN